MKSKFLTPFFMILPLSHISNVGQNACAPVKVAVVDTGLDLTDIRLKKHLCPTGHKNFVDGESLDDTEGHGTHIVGLIEKYARNSNYCILVYKFYSDSASGFLDQKREVLSMRQAVRDGATIVNFSAGGPVFSEEESLVIKQNPQVTFVVAAGNEGENLDIPGNEFYPASLFYKNMEVVENVDKRGNRNPSSNYGSKVEYAENGTDVVSYLPNGGLGIMTGTSQATAIFSGKLVAKKSKECHSGE